MYPNLLKSIAVTLFGLCFCTSGYADTTTTNKKAIVKTAASSTFNLPAFSAVDITGPVKVILKGQQQKQQVIVGVAPAEIADQVDVSVKNHTLVIDAHPQQFKPTPISVEISMNQPLKNLVAGRSADVRGEYCGNPNLIITAKDAANIHLQGNNTLHAVQNDSTNAVTIEGVQSPHLLLSSGRNGKIILSGKIDELDARLEGSVLVDARRLRARSAHILTYNAAAAYVCVSEVLYGFAYDDSNIYYYEHPQRVLKDTHASGNVLKVY